MELVTPISAFVALPFVLAIASPATRVGLTPTMDAVKGNVIDQPEALANEGIAPISPPCKLKCNVAYQMCLVKKLGLARCSHEKCDDADCKGCMRCKADKSPVHREVPSDTEAWKLETEPPLAVMGDCVSRPCAGNYYACKKRRSEKECRDSTCGQRFCWRACTPLCKDYPEPPAGLEAA